MGVIIEEIVSISIFWKSKLNISIAPDFGAVVSHTQRADIDQPVHINWIAAYENIITCIWESIKGMNVTGTII